MPCRESQRRARSALNQSTSLFCRGLRPLSPSSASPREPPPGAPCAHAARRPLHALAVHAPALLALQPLRRPALRWISCILHAGQRSAGAVDAVVWLRLIRARGGRRRRARPSAGRSAYRGASWRAVEGAGSAAEAGAGAVGAVGSTKARPASRHASAPGAQSRARFLPHRSRC